MSTAPVTDIDLAAFHADPYPMLAHMRAHAPVTYVPQLGATLFTRRDDIHREEKRIDLFSSHQPAGLVTQIMGSNLMRKDAAAHQHERRALFPSLSPRTVRDHLSGQFAAIVARQLERIAPLGQADLVRDFAAPVAADALRIMTGLTNMSTDGIARASQDMIDGCANYTGDPDIAARAHAASADIDAHIDARRATLRAAPDHSVLSVLDQAGLSPAQTSGNIKVIIGGGLNEPRDALAGTLWALLAHPEQRALIAQNSASYQDAFTEYIRLVTPIGMVPRRVATHGEACGIAFEPGETIFFLFSSACRDAACFADPDRYDITRDTSAALPFGAGPHFCAGAAAARCLVAAHAVPQALARLRNLRLSGEARFAGWAFRGLTHLPVAWSP